MITKIRTQIPIYIIIPVLTVGIGILIPIAYLILRAFEADATELSDIIFRFRNLQLFINTTMLAVGVFFTTTIIALPLAWITARSDIKWKRLFTLLNILPLAIPGYVMAYALLGFSGPHGTSAELFGIIIPRPSGYLGALISLTLYLTPYMFINLRAALLGIDPSLEETSRSFGYPPAGVFYHAILPQLRPAFYAGGLIVILHVIGDFGVVSLMQYETFSYALFIQYSAAFDRMYAAWLALFLISMTVSLLIIDSLLLRKMRFHRSGRGQVRHQASVPLGVWKTPAYFFLFLFSATSLVLPISTILYWSGSYTTIITTVYGALIGSLSVSMPASILATGLAIPLAYLGVRHPSMLSHIIERFAYVGYAIPPLAFALSIIFFTLHIAPFLYQTIFILIFAFTIHYLAEAIGPVRSSLHQAPPQLEEAARSFGHSRIYSFFIATFPRLRKGLISSSAFVFLSAMKELPLTFLLSPIGFETLALNVWSYTIEAMFAEAAPFALLIVLVSGIFVGFLLVHEEPEMKRSSI